MKLFIIIITGIVLVLLDSCSPSNKLALSKDTRSSSATSSAIAAPTQTPSLSVNANLHAVSGNQMATAVVSSNFITTDQPVQNSILLIASTKKDSGTIQQKRIIQIDTTTALMFNGLRYKYGMRTDVDLEKARRYYMVAAKRNSPEAFNALGIMYLNGNGVKRDTTTAYALLMRGAQLHSTNALCNLGDMYLKGNGVVQDFHKAYLLYVHAAESNSVKGCYGAGYMLYKGQGVKQNYTKAIDYFEQAASKGDANSLYMLGCCNMYGYGVQQNIEKAKEYFTKSMQKGHGWVGELIQKHTLDSVKNHPYLQTVSLTDVKKHRFNPEQMPMAVNSFCTDSLQGKWTGKLYTYDWSRSRVEREDDMTLELNGNNTTLNGKWYAGDKLLFNFQALKNEKTWQITTQQQVDSTRKIKVDLKKLFVQADSSVLRGNIVQYSKLRKEPLKPSCFILDHIAQPILAADSTFILNTLYPNPFSNSFSVSFTVKKHDRISFRINDMSGHCYYTYPAKEYEPGHYSVTLAPALPVGNYNLTATGRSLTLYKNIIKQ